MNALIGKPVALAAALSIAGCAARMPPESEDFYLVYSPDQRVNQPVKYFNGEYQKIQERRKRASITPTAQGKPVDGKPAKLLGIGLSGGGIRSAAYQLGLLDGLRQKRAAAGPHSIPLLDRVDYLSCVSGGCWAAGAYLIASEPTDEFFACLNEQALKGTVDPQCKRAESVLRNTQTVELAETRTKEKWEEEIRKAYFPEPCREFEFADRESPCWSHFTGKPYIVFNATHGALSPTRTLSANIENLPFQITPDQLGTLVDCGSRGLEEHGQCGFLKNALAGTDKVGFFARQGAKDFAWVRRERSFRDSFWLRLQTYPGTQMSKAMAQASAVIGTPKALSFSMGLTHKGEFPSHSDRIRDNYFLTDGGFVENLGLLPLVERGVDVIVLSDMGYPKREEGDLDMAKAQVHKLLNCNVIPDNEPSRTQLLSTLTYTCGHGSGSRGTILYVRPYPEHISAFKEQLAKDQPDLLACIEDPTHACYGRNPPPLSNPKRSAPLEQEHRFPLTDTMLMEYDKRLIRAYYLLGKFIGEKEVAPIVAAALKSE